MKDTTTTASSMHQHHRDYASVMELASGTSKDDKNKKEHNFPVRLHYVLHEMEKDCLEDVISWQPHGRAFMVRDTKRFEEQYLPLWFRQTKIASFQRQLNIYGFTRITNGVDKGCYYHELFLRGKSFVAQKIQRRKTGPAGRREHVDKTPNLYSLPYLPLHEGIVKVNQPSVVVSPPTEQSSPHAVYGGPVVCDSRPVTVSRSSGPRTPLLDACGGAEAAAVAVLMSRSRPQLSREITALSMARGLLHPTSSRMQGANSMFPSPFQGATSSYYASVVGSQQQPSLLSLRGGSSGLGTRAALERMGYGP